MEPRGVSEDNQVNSHPSSSSNDEERSASTTSSRIPSHVFSPTNTNSVAEWSVNSSESLFSINTGNTSFNDKSWRELDPAIISTQVFEFPPTENNKELGSLKSDENEADNLGRSMSFAFPILTDEADKNNSGKRDTKNKKQASAEHTPPETPKPLRVPEAPKAETPKATQSGCPKRCFSCFSCFPSCP